MKCRAILWAWFTSRRFHFSAVGLFRIPGIDRGWREDRSRIQHNCLGGKISAGGGCDTKAPPAIREQATKSRIGFELHYSGPEFRGQSSFPDMHPTMAMRTTGWA